MTLCENNERYSAVEVVSESDSEFINDNNRQLIMMQIIIIALLA